MCRKEWVAILPLVEQVRRGDAVRVDRRLETGDRIMVYRSGASVVVMIQFVSKEVEDVEKH